MVRNLHDAGHRGDPRRGLQPHRRRQPAGPDALASAASTTPATTACRPKTRATTWTSPAAATRSTCSNPRVLQLIMDSLRYWVIEMHVDGFRFDLASTLARELHEVEQAGRVLRHHPPGPGALAGEADRRAVGLGRRAATRSATSPSLWSEWNGKYRDCVRSFWKGDGGVRRRVRHAAQRLQRPLRVERPPAARQHQLHHLPRRLHARTTWSRYNHKHNEANGEDNRDGANDNNSWNCGAEGPTDDPKINELREKKKRSFLATLLFSQGVPMLLAGDEIGHTQHGNNNAYCQDNELTWLNWKLDDARRSLLEFVAKVIAIFTKQPTLPPPPLLPRQGDPRRRSRRRSPGSTRPARR